MGGASEKRRRGEGARAPGLSRERILDAAVAVVADEGLDALSMRRLAQALDVWPMALYRYFEDKDALLDAIVERATAEVARPAAGGSPRQRMRELLHGAREALGGDAPGLGEWLPRALFTAGGLRLTEEGLAILADAGLEPDEAALAWRAALGYTVGCVAQGFPAEDFDYGLDRLLDGIERRAEATA